MSSLKRINSALVSVYHKDDLDKIVLKLNELNVSLYSTGGTKDFIQRLGIPVRAVEDLTTYPSILGGRVKTLHPKVFGGILARRENKEDLEQLDQYEIPEFDLVIVDLYPFEETVATTSDENEIIEKIDIGGISLIRAAAKNFQDVLIISHREQYNRLLELLSSGGGETTLEERKHFAAEAFAVSSRYDTAIFNHFNQQQEVLQFQQSITPGKPLRYGENPHQKGIFFGNFDGIFTQVHGKEISYNNLLDIDAAVNLIAEFEETTFAVLKHNNACGIASRDTLIDAWKDALAGDPVSAFGGVLATNVKLDQQTAEEINKLFFEVIIAPDYSDEALDILKQKKNRILLIHKPADLPGYSYRSVLNGALFQDKDLATEKIEDLKTITKIHPMDKEKSDLVFANKVVKHTKSNCIVLAKNHQLLASGVGQTSRVDALKQAIEKARIFGMDLEGAVMASDAFFPFPDCVEIAHEAGITSVVQPGGSIRDKESIDFCDDHGMSMVFTGIRHFKH